jgi:hypothetical protein
MIEDLMCFESTPFFFCYIGGFDSRAPKLKPIQLELEPIIGL